MIAFGTSRFNNRADQLEIRRRCGNRHDIRTAVDQSIVLFLIFVIFRHRKNAEFIFHFAHLSEQKVTRLHKLKQDIANGEQSHTGTSEGVTLFDGTGIVVEQCGNFSENIDGMFLHNRIRQHKIVGNRDHSAVTCIECACQQTVAERRRKAVIIRTVARTVTVEVSIRIGCQFIQQIVCPFAVIDDLIQIGKIQRCRVGLVVQHQPCLRGVAEHHITFQHQKLIADRCSFTNGFCIPRLFEINIRNIGPASEKSRRCQRAGIENLIEYQIIRIFTRIDGIAQLRSNLIVGNTAIN